LDAQNKVVFHRHDVQ